MAKKKPDPSLKGKKPVNTAKRKDVKVQRNPSHITNRLKRSEMYGKYLQQKRAAKKEARLKRLKDAEELGEDVEVPSSEKKTTTTKTIDNTREVEPTLVMPDDVEVHGDEADDEFAQYFAGDVEPKVLITTRPRPSQHVFHFIADLQKLIPKLHFYPRQSYSIKEVCTFAKARDFTHLIVLSEKSKKCNGMTISHLQSHPDPIVGGGGPTAFFKLSNVVTSKNIPNHGASTSHIPELHLHGFATRLGHRIGRLFASMFPITQPQFVGRQVVTFHNQRDYVFVRHHRYIFEEDKKKKKSAAEKQKKAAAVAASGGRRGGGADADASDDLNVKARLQELGPRFTLKVRWIQGGMFDTKYGEYEWIHKRKEMDTTRRKFHL